MKLYRTTQGILVEVEGSFHAVPGRGWSELLADPALLSLARLAAKTAPVRFDPASVLAPIAEQEVWAAGDWTRRSGSYPVRCELVGARARADTGHQSGWEDCRLHHSNDMSSRDIEGENPLYLPQAKVYNGSCALGPAILLAEEPLPQSTTIEIEIQRNDAAVFQGSTSLAELKREPTQLVEYLFRDQSFPHGVFLMTGTGVVPGDDFTLRSGDVIRISIPAIGTLENHVA